MKYPPGDKGITTFIHPGIEILSTEEEVEEEEEEVEEGESGYKKDKQRGPIEDLLGEMDEIII